MKIFYYIIRISAKAECLEEIYINFNGKVIYMKLMFTPKQTKNVFSKMCHCQCRNPFSSAPGMKIVHRS